MLVRDSYFDYCNKFKLVWNYLRSLSVDEDRVVSEICKHRGYSIARMGRILKEAEFIFIDTEKEIDLNKIAFEELGLLRKVTKKPSNSLNISDLSIDDVKNLINGSKQAENSKTKLDGYEFRLKGMYIFPVKNMIGNVIALIGWYPGRKYITTPSKFFNKSSLFYGMEQIGKTGLNKPYFIVEGIFDSLSIRAMGFNAIAQMGIKSSRVKKINYGLFSRLVAIPDNDNEGVEVVKNDEWFLPSNGSYVCITNTNKGIKLKDVDDLCRIFSEDELKDVFAEALLCRDRLIKWGI